MSFEVLCVTMHQLDFSKIKQMNIHSNVVFANQCERTSYEEFNFEGNTAKMISTQTRGVGVNRNIALCYATADICLLADDDVIYNDNAKNIILAEFDKYPNADVIVFNLETDDQFRKQIRYRKTKKQGRFGRSPWGACRIAFRLEKVKKANIWFTTLFGGGCVFPSGEDSMFIHKLKKAGLTFYVSKESIGTVSFEAGSTWFSGYDEKYYYGKGAYYQAVHPRTIFFWKYYFAFRTMKGSLLGFRDRLRWMKIGQIGYRKMLSFTDYKNNK